MKKYFICGNWKMNKTIAEGVEFAKELKNLLGEQKCQCPADVTCGIAVPFTMLSAMKKELEGTCVKVAAQNVHFADEGAYTGEISAPMLKEIGVDCVIIGHSERRQYFAETDSTCNKKILKALEFGIQPILCVGETLAEREAKIHSEVVKKQLVADLEDLSAEQMSKVVIAYEPIWAIGTGKTASADDAENMCAFIKEVITTLFDEKIAEETIVQYGGSVKPSNVKELMEKPNIGGALVGGASLKANDFIQLINFR